MQDVVDLLDSKVLNVNLNNPKANPGCVMLYPHRQDLPVIVETAFSILGQRFRSYKRNVSTKLTSLSTSIGQYTVGILCREEALDYGASQDIWPYTHDTNHPEQRFRDELRIGDLIIDAMIRCEYITLYRESTNQYSTSPYEIRPGFRWSEASIQNPTLMGTVFEVPKPITGTYQKTPQERFKVIKGWNQCGISIRECLEDQWVKGLNKIQQVPWQINQDVLAALKGKPLISEESDNEKRVLQARSRNYAHQMIVNKAEAIGTSTFWQFYDCDYRGRVYCKESFLEFQGSDEARGLFQFADAKPLGERGLFWLKVHAACCFNKTYSIHEVSDQYVTHLNKEGLLSISVDKMTLEDRAKWADDHMDLIKETADGKIIRDDAEKPVSFLAACLELAGASADSLSRLPIPIDGSNNGWQHLAAMSKDADAGALVSLTDQEIQEDFYVKVAKKLYDISEGEYKAILHKMPMKDIRKGIAKRAAMTRAYSCGAKRMAESMWHDCYIEDYHVKYGITEEHCIQFSKDIIKAIDEVCTGPLKTMKYLQEIASHELVQNKKNELFWWSPSGFPVRYRAYKTNAIKHHGRIAGKQIKHTGQIEFDLPDVKKFASGISPNYVHSQDAAHMVIVAAEWDGTFGAVHDSFSTHASDIDDLGKLVRDVFVQMYDHEDFFIEIRDDIMNDHEGFNFEYSQGSLDINSVKQSRYFFC